MISEPAKPPWFLADQENIIPVIDNLELLF